MAWHGSAQLCSVEKAGCRLVLQLLCHRGALKAARRLPETCVYGRHCVEDGGCLSLLGPEKLVTKLARQPAPKVLCVVVMTMVVGCRESWWIGWNES